jgi:DNA-directed RNA polymerase specialized sigma24 family protein
VDRSAALDSLPPVYGAVLRYRRDGLDDGTIATRLGLEPQSVTLLVHLAELKIARLVGNPED